MNGLNPVVSDAILSTKSRKLAPRLVEEGAIPGIVGDPEKHGGRVSDRTESALAFAKGVYLCLKEA